MTRLIEEFIAAVDASGEVRKPFPVEQQLPLPFLDPTVKRADMADPGPATATANLEN